MGLILTGIVVVAGAGAVATIVAMTIHGRIRQETLTDFRDHSGLVSGVSGTLFAITVGMLVVASWGAIGTAKDNVAAEARSLEDLTWFAHTMHQPFQNRLTALLQTYTQQVVTLDWPEMASQETLSQPAWNTLNAIRYEFSVYEPKPAAELTRYQQALGQLQAVYDDRLERQDEARTSVPGILWLALVISGSVVVLVPVIFGSTRRGVHGMLAFLTAGIMAFVLFMIAEFTHPFSGSISVTPEAFESTEQNIQQIDTLWATANVQQARAIFKPAPEPSSIMSLLATPTPNPHERKKHDDHKETKAAEPVPGLPAPGVPAPVVPASSPTPAAPAPAPTGSSISSAPPPTEQGSPEPQEASSP